MLEQSTSLQLSEVLDGVYQKLKAESRVVKEFSDAHAHWASYWNFGTEYVSFWFDGFIVEVAAELGIVVTKGKIGGADWLKDFDEGIILSRIAIGAHTRESIEGKWDRSIYGSLPIKDKQGRRIEEKNWQDVSPDHVEMTLTHLVSSTSRKSALLCHWRDRLFLDDHEVTQFIAEQATYGKNEASFRIGGFRGSMFSEPSREIPHSLPTVLTPATYHPQIIDLLTESIQRKTGINQPQLI